MKSKFVFAGVVALTSLLFTGCRDDYETRAELQSLHPDAAVLQLPNTDTWLIRLPSGAVLVAADVSAVPTTIPLLPVQVISPLRVDEFDPEYRTQVLERDERK